jgi:hypothetical protein
VQGLARSPSMPAQKLRHRRASQRPGLELLRRYRCHYVLPLRGQCPQHPVISGSLPCGPATYARGHAHRVPASVPTQTWPKFKPGMGRTGCIDLVASSRGEGAGDAPVRSDQIGCTRTRCVDPLEMP